MIGPASSTGGRTVIVTRTSFNSGSREILEFAAQSMSTGPRRNSRCHRSRALIHGALVCALGSVSVTSRAQAIDLIVPIDCELGHTCVIQNYVDHDPSAGARDYKCGKLTYDGHKGTDFRLPTVTAQRAGVNVLAAADGQVLRVRDGVADVLLQRSSLPPAGDRACGNGLVIAHSDGWETQYCHLARGSVTLAPGARVAAGQVIGRVGLSGRTQFPHLHFGVRHGGQVVDPFALASGADTCDGGTALWTGPARSSLQYRARSVLNAGFATNRVTSRQIELDEVTPQPLRRDAPALIGFVRVVGLRAADAQRFSITGPDGSLIVDTAAQPLERDQAEYTIFAGRKRHGDHWPPGTYRADYRVTNAGQTLLEKSFALTLSR